MGDTKSPDYVSKYPPAKPGALILDLRRFEWISNELIFSLSSEFRQVYCSTSCLTAPIIPQRIDLT
ncbi:hypothetical protein, partial [Thiolapillus sp.]